MKHRALTYNQWDSLNEQQSHHLSYPEFETIADFDKDKSPGIKGRRNVNIDRAVYTVNFYKQRGGQADTFLIDHYGEVYYTDGYGPLYYANDDHAGSFHDHSTYTGDRYDDISDVIAKFNYNDKKKEVEELISEFGEEYVETMGLDTKWGPDIESMGAEIVDSKLVNDRYHEVVVSDGEWLWEAKIFPNGDIKYYTDGIGPLDDTCPDGKYMDDLYDEAPDGRTRFEVIDQIVKEYAKTI